MEDPIKIKGRLQIYLNDEKVQEVDNLVVTAGRDFVASRMTGTSAAVMSHMAVGTGTTAAAIGQTTLVTESGRVANTSAVVTTNSIAYTATFPAGTATAALTEAGIFNASSAGTMLCRTVFSAINKGAADSLTIVWTVTVS